MFDIVCMGESVIDFTPTSLNASVSSCPGFIKNPGGSALNTATQAARLGAKVSLVTRFGKDPFSQYLKDFLASEHVDYSHAVYGQSFHPPLAFVSYHDKKPQFHIVKDHAQKNFLESSEFPFEILEKTRIFAFGSIFSYQKAAYKTVLKILKKCSKHNVFTCFDPNIRLHTIASLDEAVGFIEDYMPFISCVKMSIDDAHALYSLPVDNICQRLEALGAQQIILTQDIHGGFFWKNGKKVPFRSWPEHSGDSVGAGDTFNAAFLTEIAKNLSKTGGFPYNTIHSILESASIAASLCCKKHGALAEKISRRKIGTLKKKTLSGKSLL